MLTCLASSKSIFSVALTCKKFIVFTLHNQKLWKSLINMNYLEIYSNPDIEVLIKKFMPRWDVIFRWNAHLDKSAKIWPNNYTKRLVCKTPFGLSSSTEPTMVWEECFKDCKINRRFVGEMELNPILGDLQKHGKGMLQYISPSRERIMILGRWYMDCLVEGEKYINGSHMYRGEMDDLSKCNGFGVYTNIDGTNVITEYIGEWKDDKMYGTGKCTYRDDAFVPLKSYKGSMSQGKRHGHGKLVYSNGSIYVGNFEDDIPKGQGKRIYTDGGYSKARWDGLHMQIRSPFVIKDVKGNKLYGILTRTEGISIKLFKCSKSLDDPKFKGKEFANLQWVWYTINEKQGIVSWDEQIYSAQMSNISYCPCSIRHPSEHALFLEFVKKGYHCMNADAVKIMLEEEEREIIAVPEMDM